MDVQFSSVPLGRTIGFTIKLPPHGQSRARAVASYSPRDQKIITGVRKSPKEKAEQEAFRWAAAPFVRNELWSCPMVLGVWCYFPIPKSWPKWRREQAKLGQHFHQAKPDLDNIFKFVKDCLTGMIWTDDKLICGYLPSGKLYGPNPGYRITVAELKCEKVPST